MTDIKASHEEPRLLNLGNGLTRIDNAWSCERCELIFVGPHYSADHCNETGDDLTLCEGCCEEANAERVRWTIVRSQATGMWVVSRNGERVGEATTAAMAASIIVEAAP